MKHRYPVSPVSVLVLLSFFATACASIPTPAPATATFTPSPQPTNTFLPTVTLTPSATPDVAATQEAEDFNVLLNKFVTAGYLNSTAGNFVELTKGSQPNNWYSSKEVSDLLLKAHFSWSPTKADPQSLGCWINFGVQTGTSSGSSQPQFMFTFNKSSIQLAWLKGNMYAYEIGKTSGTGRVDFEDKTETDFALLVKGQSAYISFDGKVTKYTLSADWKTLGIVGISGDPNGTCKISNLTLWAPQ